SGRYVRRASAPTPGPQVRSVEDLPEPSHALRELPRPEAAVAEDETLQPRAAVVARGQRKRAHPLLGGPAGDLEIPVSRFQHERQEHSGLVADDSNAGTELALQSRDERVAALAADRPRLPEVAVEVPFPKEVREDALEEERRKHVHRPTDRRERLDE